jgi:predicted MPP superfamily phosphohydrolase
VQVTRTEIRVDRAVLGRERFRIVHLSDLHLVEFGRRELRVVERVREAKPQVILLTGDYMNVREAMDDLDRMLRLLAAEAPLGVYAVGGNMDTKFITRTIFERAGLRYLEDDTHLIPGPDGTRGLRLVGHSVRPAAPLRELLQGISDDAFTVYLQHSPDAVDELRDRGADQRVDLFLCGHTHGGQVCLPFWGAIVTLTKSHKKYERGRYEARGVPMYVNRGVGTTGPPVRFLARPEVAVIDLVAGP